MNKTLNAEQAAGLLEILIRDTKHRAGKPFNRELINHVTNPATAGNKYWFLSSEYHQFNLLRANDNSFFVEAISEDPKVLASVQRANAEIERFFKLVKTGV